MCERLPAFAFHAGRAIIACVFLGTAWLRAASDPGSFDGRPWNVSSGNLSVNFIQASPVGAHPRPGVIEAPPSVASQVRLKALGLVANEDYIAWGAIERELGKWQWGQHDAVEQTLHQAGLKYVVYDWVHFPPVWLREQQAEQRTLMKCLEHGRETHYLSIFDPRTIDWYDHFYRALHDHFGDRIDDVYACILGPYGEGNYPLNVPDWVNIGHCHEGYWCGDEYAIGAYQAALKKKYRQISRLNGAWGASYRSFDEVAPPKELRDEKFKPSLQAFVAAQDRRRWLDFITWYHQAIIDFAEQSVRTVLKYFPPGKVRLKPGGNAGGVNPIAWGTYCPGYAKMAQPYRIVLQPADCQGAVFGDKWLGTAYRFYGVTEATEPAGDLDENAFVRRMFSDASCGASQLFTYQFERHATNIQKYVHLYRGIPGETEIAVLCPTTLYRLGENLQPTIKAARSLRDLCEFDVLDELLVGDGALTTNRYRTLLLFQADIVDAPILAKIDAFRQAGGKVVAVNDAEVRDVEGRLWAPAGVIHVSLTDKSRQWLEELAPHLAGQKGYDGEIDGVWTCRRGDETLLFNSRDKSVEVAVKGRHVAVPPHSIWSGRTSEGR